MLTSFNEKDIFIWTDNQYNEIDLLNLGFSIFSEQKPDYQYFTNKGRGNIKRYPKHLLKKTKEERSLNKSERNLRREQKYYQIFNAGKRLWVKKRD
jgi:hypothetical protein